MPSNSTSNSHGDRPAIVERSRVPNRSVSSTLLSKFLIVVGMLSLSMAAYLCGPLLADFVELVRQSAVAPVGGADDIAMESFSQRLGLNSYFSQGSQPC